MRSMPGGNQPAGEEGEAWLRRLRAWLPGRRWYGATGMEPAALTIADCATLPQSAEAQWLLLAACMPDGATVEFQAAARMGDERLEGLEEAGVRQALLALIAAEARLPGRAGTFAGHRWLDGAVPLTGASSRIAGGEQSNTSLIYSDAGGTPRWILKLFRRVTSGAQPEIEVPLALARSTGFRAIAAPAGELRYEPAGGGAAAALGVLQPYIANRGDGWNWVLRKLQAGPAAGAALLPELARLGERSAELHLALASLTDEASLAPEPITAADLAAWRERIVREARTVAGELRARGGGSDVGARLERLTAGDFPLAGLEGILKIRHHGDYHLGQVLRTAAGDFVILDFEGEPARPLHERRQKACALKDAAGMLRSFSYAAHAAGAPGSWEDRARTAFWEAYDGVLRTAPLALAPARPTDRERALRFFEIEKAVYELGYELHHRPDWVELPLAGLRRLL